MDTEIQSSQAPAQESPQASPAPAAPSSPGPQASPAASPATPGSAPTPGAPPAAGAPIVPAPYVPNHKFKSMGKEQEFDAFIKDVVKDAETEKKVRELYEKSTGLDIVKPKLQETRQQLQTVTQQHQQVLGQIQDLRQIAEKGDYDTFFQRLAIPQEKVLQWVLDKVNYSQLPAEQREIIDARKSAEARAWQAEQQARVMQSSYEQQAVHAKGFALSVALEKPDVKQFADAFDARAGRPGAFKDAVCEHGDYTWRKSQGKVDLTPEQAVMALIQQYQPFLGQPQAPAPQAPAAPEAPRQAGQQPQVPVIPNVGGRSSASPTKQAPKNLSELKKLASQMQ